MEKYVEMDDDMRELVSVLGRAIVPHKKRRAAVSHVCQHSPYYSQNRYKRIG